MNSPAAILIRLALSVLLDVCTVIYLLVAWAMGWEIAWRTAMGAFLLACTLAPPLCEVRALMAEVEAHIKRMAEGP